ncbi:hypothetical protein PHYPO_G00112660 [Pangasianodon hypophthalmus]|uniref:ZP domain-containing protein n=1 Tax=Pangasianodon hypophthalmus TaxID=310915 RepID=A0A5N5L2E7_PANHP|nr:hypothetical protein PHYPO_G00112660 [Pangasianodon hypophthalmus]
MLWQEKEMCSMVMAVLMLISSAFCLEIAPQGKSVQFGRLLIGSSKTTNETKAGVVKKVYDEYAGDTNGYQSDQPDLTEGSQLAKLMFRRWSPSVQCDKDSMTLRIQGRRVPNFLVETSEKGPVPLSLMPSHCGFSVKRARRDVALVANYDGCNVAQQGNTYILPLRVLGVAVKMACPVTRPLTTVSCSPSAMVANLGQSTDAVRLKVNGVWQPVYQASTTCGFTLEVVGGGLTLTAPYTSNCWKFEGAEMLLSVQYMDGEVTLSCSAVQSPATTALPADMPFPATSPLLQAPMSYPFHYSYEGSQLAKLIFRRWSPSVQCEKDSMTLRIQGRRVPNFLIETSERGPVPLSLMPSHCGFSVKRARRDVALVANYDGCNVAQQGNTYILPLRVLGVAVKMACPVTRPLTTVSCSPSAMVANLGQSTDAVRLKVNGVWQPVYQASTTCGFTLEVVGGGLTLTAPYTSNCWKFEGAEMLLSVQYMDGEVTLSCSAVQTPATTALPADMQPGTLSDASLTTTDAPATDQQLFYPYYNSANYSSYHSCSSQ